MVYPTRSVTRSCESEAVKVELCEGISSKRKRTPAETLDYLHKYPNPETQAINSRETIDGYTKLRKYFLYKIDYERKKALFHEDKAKRFRKSSTHYTSLLRALSGLSEEEARNRHIIDDFFDEVISRDSEGKS